MKKYFVVFSMLCFAFLYGCKTEHKVEVEVKPMHITMDINIRIDRELENFFGSLDEAAKATGGEKTEQVEKKTETGKTEESPKSTQ